MSTDPHGIPPHTAELDQDLAQTLGRSRRVMTVAVGMLAVIVLAGFILTGAIIGSQRAQIGTQGKELDAACLFFRDLSGVPVKPAPPLTRPSKLTVLLVTHSREAYIGLGCRPDPPLADPSLVFWARYYHIRVPLSNPRVVRCPCLP